MSKKLVACMMTAPLGLALALGSACGPGNDRGYADPAGGTSGGEGTSGGPGEGTSGTDPQLGSSGTGNPDSGLGTCAADTQSAKQLPVDIFIMLDASGSMMAQTGATGTGPTKWASVKTALTGFLSDPKSAGIGVGLQVFPITHAGAPASCASNADCTVAGTSLGRCFLKVCPPVANAPLLSCDSPADCGGGACRELGVCRAGFLTFGDCLVGDTCFFGSCQAITQSTCDRQECVLDDYNKASVAIGALPGNAAALLGKISSFADPPPDALTPTSAAVEGGLAYSKQFAIANPGHAVVMVLVTDGFPTRCAPLDTSGIAALAASAAGGTPNVKTFVIGVFTDEEKAEATAKLDTIANSGGTNKAVVITTGGNVTTELQTALDLIRGQALPCEYAVPKPATGTPDYDKVNVQLTPGTGTPSVIGFKKNAQACDGAGGWYYDVDPSSGSTPTKILLCPSSCESVKKATGAAKLEILLGCKTIIK